MRTLSLLIAAAVGSASLAGCDRSATPEKAAEKPGATGLAEAGKPGADTRRPAEPFKSAVTGKPAPGSPQAADAELSNKVKTALRDAPDLRTAGLEVASADGVVTLYGTVDAPVEKDRAAMLAMEIDGVRSVVNNLVVVKGAS